MSDALRWCQASIGDGECHHPGCPQAVEYRPSCPLPWAGRDGTVLMPDGRVLEHDEAEREIEVKLRPVEREEGRDDDR